MKLIYMCKHCSKTNGIPYTASDRAGLRDAMGYKTQLVCSHCKTNNEIEINDIRAIQNPKSGLVFFAAFLIVGVSTYILFNSYWREEGTNLLVYTAFGWVIAIPFLVVGAFNRSENKRIKTFNSYYI